MTAFTTFPYRVIQAGIFFGFMLPLWLATRVLWMLHPRTLLGVAINGYYWTLVNQRRIAGLPLWQPRDQLLGKFPPPGHPFWDTTCPPAPPPEPPLYTGGL